MEMLKSKDKVQLISVAGALQAAVGVSANPQRPSLPDYPTLMRLTGIHLRRLNRELLEEDAS